MSRRADNRPSYSFIPRFILDAEPACSTVDPELFFPQEVEVGKFKVVSKYTNLAAARAICEGCPLKLKCFEYAMKNPVVGVWGGTTERQREDYRYKGLPIKYKSR